MLANAAHIKNVPGRKTDVNDATWIADLLACGLIKASFVPEEAIQELRSLLRTRKQLTREQTSHVQRIQKTLEEANIKLDSVISDILGLSGRRMIEAMIAGVTDPAASWPHWPTGGSRRRAKELYDALHGRLTEHHRFLLGLHLEQYDALEKTIAEIDRRGRGARSRAWTRRRRPVEAPFRSLIELLCTIPGVSILGAMIILSEIGRDMSRFPTAGHLLAWAGLCPGQNESAGKRKSLAPAQGRALAEDHAGPMRLGGQAEERQLLQGAVLSAAGQTRSDRRPSAPSPPRS